MKQKTALQKLVTDVCEQNGWTQAEVQQRAGIGSRATFCHLCAGRQIVGEDYLRRLAGALGKPFEDVQRAYQKTCQVSPVNRSDPDWRARRSARLQRRDTSLRRLVGLACAELRLTYTDLLDKMGRHSYDQLCGILAGRLTASDQYLADLATALDRPLKAITTAYQRTVRVQKLDRQTAAFFTEAEFALVAAAAGMQPVNQWLRQLALCSLQAPHLLSASRPPASPPDGRLAHKATLHFTQKEFAELTRTAKPVAVHQWLRSLALQSVTRGQCVAVNGA